MIYSAPFFFSLRKFSSRLHHISSFHLMHFFVLAFVASLTGWESDEDSLRDYFGRYGRVSDCVIMRDRQSGHPRGFGFVSYDDEAVADRVAAERHELDGRQVEAKRAVPRSECVPTARTHMRATKKVFIGGLPSTCDDNELSEYFTRFGDITECQVMYDHQTSNSRGFGFVTFSTESIVDRVVNMDHEIMGKFVEVKRAEPKQVLEARRNNNSNTTATTTTTTTNSIIINSNITDLNNNTNSNLSTPSPSSLANGHALTSNSSSQLPRPHVLAASPTAMSSQQPYMRSIADPAAFAAVATAAAAAGVTPPALSALHVSNPQAVQSSPFSSFPQSHHGNPWSMATASQTSTMPPLSGAASPASFASPHVDATGPTPATTGMGYYTPATCYPPEITEFVQSALYGPSFKHGSPAFSSLYGMPSARADRRMQPYPMTRERVERSYR